MNVQHTWLPLDYHKHGPIWIKGDTHWERTWRANPTAKEPWTVAWIESLPSDTVLYNVGANVGSYALIAGKRGILTYAFEPGFANYAALCSNVIANNLADWVLPVPVGLSFTDGIGVFDYTRTEAGAAMHVASALRLGFPYRERRLPAVYYTLDTFAELAFAPPTHLLIDVDGHEAAVLTGAEKTLPHVRSALVEMTDTDDRLISDTIEHLTKAGLELVARFDERDGRRIDGVWYGIFARS